MSTHESRPPPASRADLALYLDLIESEARAVLKRRRLPLTSFLGDAIQDGFVGLAQAFDRYRGEKGPSFEAYARPCVRGAILNALDRGRRADPMKVLLEGADAMAGDFAEHHVVHDEEIQTQAGAAVATRKGVEGHLTALGLGFLASIHRLDPEIALTARRQYAAALDVLQQLTARLAQREQTVIHLRMSTDLTWDEIAEEMGRPRSTVQRWFDNAVERLRESLAERGIVEMPPLPDREDDEEEE